MLFALLFAIYGTELVATAGAPGPAAEFKLGSAFAETLVLLTSSFTFGMASLAMKYGRSRAPLVGLLLATLGLGALFLGLELHDFATMFADEAYPTRSGFPDRLLDADHPVDGGWNAGRPVQPAHAHDVGAREQAGSHPTNPAGVRRERHVTRRGSAPGRTGRAPC